MLEQVVISPAPINVMALAAAASVVALTVDVHADESVALNARTRELYDVLAVRPESVTATVLAARFVPTCAKFVQAAPEQRSTRKPVSFVVLSVHARLIFVADTAVAVNPIGARIAGGGGGGGGGGGFVPLSFLQAPKAPITPAAVKTSAARTMLRDVTFIHLSP